MPVAVRTWRVTAVSPLLALTLVAAALRLGFSANAIEALAGTLTVPLLYDGVRRAAGRPAALAAAAALALTPEALLASGSADAVMTLLVVLALWLAVADTGVRGPARAAAAGAAVGLACAIRPAEAAVCIPALLVLWLGTSRSRAAIPGDSPPGNPRRKFAPEFPEVALAALVGGIVAVVARLLVGGTPTGAVGGGLARSGLLVLVSAGSLQYDSVFGDVLVATLAVCVAALAVAAVDRRAASGGRRDPRRGGRRALALATGVWIASGLIAFAATGLTDGRHLEAAAPALAIALGLGAVRLAGFGSPVAGRRRPATLALVLALAGICAYAFHFGEPSISWGTFALLEAAVGAALLTAAPGWPRALGRWGVGVIVIACSLAAPVHETLALVRAGWARSIGIAGIASGGLGETAASRAAGTPPTGGAGPIGPITSVAVSAHEVGAPMPRGFLGFSFEYPALLSYAGTDPAAVNPVLLALVRGLNPAGAPVLRIGGDSTDHTWWPVPGMRRPGGVNVDLTSNWLRVAHAVADDLGGKLILGVNLAADDPALAAAEARALLGGIGRRDIEALEIGNEADVYAEFPWYRGRDGHVHFARHRSYGLVDFIDDFDRWRSMMPPAPLAGPAFAHPDWMTGLQTFVGTERGLSLVTFHRYPTRACRSNSSDAAAATIPNLMADAASSGLAARVAPYVATAHAARLPFRLDELNSASCAGKTGVSNTFAASLWVLDTLFHLAAVGVDGVNIHTLPGAAYAPFEFTRQGGQWSAEVRPLYYGLLLFADAFPAGAHLLAVQSAGGTVKAWATTGPGDRLHVVLINDDPQSAVTVRLQLPGPQVPLTVAALQAPGLAATSGITLGGESFGASTTTGVLPPNPRPARASSVLGSYLVTVPAATAVMLTR